MDVLRPNIVNISVKHVSPVTDHTIYIHCTFITVINNVNNNMNNEYMGLFQIARRNNFDFEQHWNTMCVPFLTHEKLQIKIQDAVEIIHNSIWTQKDYQYVYDYTLPPCIALLSQELLLSSYTQTLNELFAKYHFDGSNLNSEDLRLHIHLAHSWLLPAMDQFILELEIIFRRVGFRYWLDVRAEVPFSIEALKVYYAKTRTAIHWYVLPHFCRPWNQLFSLTLAQLIYPSHSYLTVENNLNNDDHCTVYSHTNQQYFDILAYAGF